MESCLGALPDLVLIRISSFLEPEDTSRLSQTCKRLRSVLPRYLFLKGPDFHIYGPRGGHWSPGPYFKGPPLSGRVKKMSISLTWQDQGWGNQKGEVFVSLMRGSEEIARKRRPNGIAPHSEGDSKTVLVDEPIITKAEPGDYYEFTRNAGGGGGHQLIVKNYKVIIEYR